MKDFITNEHILNFYHQRQFKQIYVQSRHNESYRVDVIEFSDCFGCLCLYTHREQANSLFGKIKFLVVK